MAASGGPAEARLHLPRRRVVGVTDNATIRENRNPSDGGWRATDDIRNADDVRRQIQGYASSTSVNLGESLDFHISVAGSRPFTITVYRLGHYGGIGSRRMLVSERLTAARQPIPSPSATTGLIECSWPATWTLDVPRDWTSGFYLAVLQTTDGIRYHIPFVVRDDQRDSDFVVVLPFTTYQAYNLWPANGSTGKNLYKGYTGKGNVLDADKRAFQVSFDRPYRGGGMPSWIKIDIAATEWIESQGYDVTYATSLDLHEGRIIPERHAALIFPGHDEYWSSAMRETVEHGIDLGTHLAFLGANNIYWHIRVEAATNGRPNRIVTCYKPDKKHPDPDPGVDGPTTRWRDLPRKNGRAEQKLLGVQYNGILARPVPMVISESDHWFWRGTGLRDGDTIAGLVAGEADGHDPKIRLKRKATQTLLSASPYVHRIGRGRRVQNTSLYETRNGTMVFAAGTFHWSLALVPSKYTDRRIQRATRNLFTGMLVEPTIER